MYTAMTAKEKTFRTHLLALQQSGFSLRKIQEVYPVSIAVLSRVTRGAFPKSDTIRCRLGIETLKFEKRLEDYPEKNEILAIYQWLGSRDSGRVNSGQLSLFPLDKNHDRGLSQPLLS